MRRLWIRRGWFFWQATNPDEITALFDFPTTVRARSRERVIERATRRFWPKSVEWEEVEPACEEEA